MEAFGDDWILWIHLGRFQWLWCYLGVIWWLISDFGCFLRRIQWIAKVFCHYLTFMGAFGDYLMDEVHINILLCFKQDRQSLSTDPFSETQQEIYLHCNRTEIRNQMWKLKESLHIPQSVWKVSNHLKFWAAQLLRLDQFFQDVLLAGYVTFGFLQLLSFLKAKLLLKGNRFWFGLRLMRTR